MRRHAKQRWRVRMLGKRLGILNGDLSVKKAYQVRPDLAEHAFVAATPIVHLDCKGGVTYATWSAPK